MALTVFTLTIPAGNVTADLTNYPVYVRLSDMPTLFWTTVASDGTDLVVKSAGVRVPHDLSRFDYVSHAGALWFKAPTLLTAVDNVFTIECGTGAVAYTAPTVTALTVTNPGAESGTTGWTNVTGALGTRAATPSPHPVHGGTTYFTGGAVVETRARQDVAIPSGHNTAVDAGERIARVRWWQAGFGSDLDRGELEMEFFTGASASLGARVGAGAWRSGSTADFNDNEWRAREFYLRIPATARTIRLSMHMLRNQGTNNDVYIDDIKLELLEVPPYSGPHVWTAYDAVFFGGEGSDDRTGQTFWYTNYDPDYFVHVDSSPAITGVYHGVCWDGTHYYVSGQGKLQKYDAAWALVTQNTTVLADSGVASATTVADCEVHAGVLYAIVRSATTSWITKWSAADLTFLGKWEVTAQCAQHGSAVAVRPRTNTIFLASVANPITFPTQGGDRLWEYALDGTYLGLVHIQHSGGGVSTVGGITAILGMTYWRNRFWLASDGPMETYSVTDDGITYKSGLYGSTAVNTWSGVGHHTEYLLQMVRPTSATNGRVDFWKPRDIPLGAGGGVNFWQDAHLTRPGVPPRTTFTLGATLSIADKTITRAAVGLWRAAAAFTDTRVTIAYSLVASRLAVWDTANSHLNSTTDPVVDTKYRVHAIYTGTTSRSFWVNGAQEAVSPGAITTAPTTLDTVLVGREDESNTESWRGDIGFVYLYPGALPAAWLAAEYFNLNTPVPFYFIGSPPDPRHHRVTQVVREVAIGEDEGPTVEPPGSDPCDGGGTVPDGVNPTTGVSLATATVPLAWLEVTFDDTTHRWAKAGIPHGSPKTGRILTFGTVVRRLTDDHGGPQAATVTTTLADTDRVLRTAAFSGALQHALVEYFVADLATVQAGGAPQRVFRGRVHDWQAEAHLTLTLTVEDDLTARLTSADAIDVQSPQRVIGRATADATPPRLAYQNPAPEAYGTIGDVSDADEDLDQAGAWEPRHTANITIEDAEELGNMPMFLVSAQPVATVQRVFAADLSQDPPVDRILVPDEAYGDWLFVPGKPGWPLDNPWYENQEGRWTVIFGNQNHPAIELAVANRIPLVVDLCGYEDVGDTTGVVIDSPARGLLHWFLNRLLEDVRDDWATTVFGLGDYSVLDTDTFEHVHDICEFRGYRLGGILGHDFTAMSWRERVAEWCRNFGFDLGTNRHGQILLTLLETESDFAGSPLFTPATILDAGCAVRMRSDAVENIVPFVFGREYTTQLQNLNPDTGERALREPVDRAWRSRVEEQRDESSIAALGGTPRGERRAARQEYSLIRDGDTAAAVSLARLQLHAPPNGRAEVTFQVLLRDGWALELGDIVRVEHWDVPWTGPRRCQVRSLSVDLDTMVITVVVREVDDLLA